MRITRRQLRRIIKEEKAKLHEQGSGAHGALAALEGTIREAYNELDEILDDWDNDPRMTSRNEYYNRIIGVTKLLEGP